MKRQIILYPTLFIFTLFIQARSFVVDNIKYEITSITSPFKVSVTSGPDYTGDIIIPSTVFYNDTIFSVTDISAMAFDSSGITSVYIPNSVNRIGIGAFYNCNALNSIIFDESNQYFVFSEGILYNQDKSQLIYCLTNKSGKIDIPNTVKIIGLGAFYNCNNIKSVFVPNSVTYIDTNAFYNCLGLTKVVIGDSTIIEGNSNIVISRLAFTGCSNINYLNLNISVSAYNNYPLGNLPSVKTLVLGNSIKTIDKYLISSFPEINKVIIGRKELSPVPVTISENAFSSCTYLDTLVLFNNMQINYYNINKISPFSKISTLSIGDQVTAICDYAFIFANNLRKVEIPEAIASIGRSAFANCSSLLNIYVDELNTNYTSINGVLFSNDRMSLIQYPSGRDGTYEIPAQTQNIGENAFSYSTGLQSITVPQTTTSVQSAAFANCSALKSITIGHADSISLIAVNINSDAFVNCTSISEIILNKDFTFTGSNNSPFKNLTALSTLHIGNGVTSIPNYAFSGCAILDSVLIGQTNEKNNNAITVSSTAFSGCTNFTSLELNRSPVISGYESPFKNIANLSIGEGVIFIGNMSFSECYNLSSVTLPSSLKRIGASAFAYCQALQSISLPDISSIGQHAFFKCEALTSIVIPNTVDTIQSYTFYGCSALSSLFLGKSIKLIQEYAFFFCNSLTELQLPDSVSSIGNYAFIGCSGLTSIALGKVLTNIGAYSFSECKNLKQINFPPLLTNIPDNAFHNCSGLSELYIPGTIKSIGSNAFTNCTGITTLTIGETNNPRQSLACSPDSPFSGCTGIKTLFLNKNIVDNTLSSPFISLKSLNTVIIGDSVTSLHTFAFYDCIKLTDISIPNSVVIISDAAFQGCTSLIQIKLPKYLRFIPNQLFYGCNKLESVMIPAGVESIGSYAFFECSSLKSIIIPEKVEIIAPLAFSSCAGLKEITTISPNPALCGFNSFTGMNKTECTLITPVESITKYKAADQWKDFINIIERELETTQFTDTISNLIKTVYINNTELSKALTKYELSNVYDLTITGNINRSDFATINTMSSLKFLDLSSANVQYNAIPSSAFRGMSRLKSIILPSTLTSIETRAFEQCSGLITLSIPSEVTSIQNIAFARCTGLFSVKLPSGLKTIEPSIFYECNRLFSVNIPSSVSSIGASAFAKCTALRSINLPASLNSIEEYAFAECIGLRSIYNFRTTPLELGYSEAFYKVNTSTCTLYVPSGSLNIYLQTYPWNAFTNIREMVATDIASPNISTLHIYPNPVNDGFYVNDLTEPGLLTILDIKGNTIFTKHIVNNEYIPFDSVPKGVYVVRIQTKNFLTEKKIMK